MSPQFCNVIVKKCHFDIVIKRFIQPPLSPFVKVFKGRFLDCPVGTYDTSPAIMKFEKLIG